MVFLTAGWSDRENPTLPVCIHACMQVFMRTARFVIWVFVLAVFCGFDIDSIIFSFPLFFFFGGQGGIELNS